MVGWMLNRLIALVSLAAIAMGGLPSHTADASTILAKVDLKRQRMEVFVDGAKRYTWPVSTGRKGWETKPGSYHPFALTRHYYSSKWKMNLPYLVSIAEDGTAIHGTEMASKLGRTASHGCIRLSMGNAARFYALIEQYGMASTEVVVTRK